MTRVYRIRIGAIEVFAPPSPAFAAPASAPSSLRAASQALRVQTSLAFKTRGRGRGDAFGVRESDAVAWGGDGGGRPQRQRGGRSAAALSVAAAAAGEAALISRPMEWYIPEADFVAKVGLVVKLFLGPRVEQLRQACVCVGEVTLGGPPGATFLSLPLVVPDVGGAEVHAVWNDERRDDADACAVASRDLRLSGDVSWRLVVRDVSVDVLRCAEPVQRTLAGDASAMQAVARMRSAVKAAFAAAKAAEVGPDAARVSRGRLVATVRASEPIAEMLGTEVQRPMQLAAALETASMHEAAAFVVGTVGDGATLLRLDDLLDVFSVAHADAAVALRRVMLDAQGRRGALARAHVKQASAEDARYLASAASARGPPRLFADLTLCFEDYTPPSAEHERHFERCCRRLVAGASAQSEVGGTALTDLFRNAEFLRHSLPTFENARGFDQLCRRATVRLFASASRAKRAPAGGSATATAASIARDLDAAVDAVERCDLRTAEVRHRRPQRLGTWFCDLTLRIRARGSSAGAPCGDVTAVVDTFELMVARGGYQQQLVREAESRGDVEAFVTAFERADRDAEIIVAIRLRIKLDRESEGGDSSTLALLAEGDAAIDAALARLQAWTPHDGAGAPTPNVVVAIDAESIAKGPTPVPRSLYDSDLTPRAFWDVLANVIRAQLASAARRRVQPAVADAAPLIHVQSECARTSQMERRDVDALVAALWRLVARGLKEYWGLEEIEAELRQSDLRAEHLPEALAAWKHFFFDIASEPHAEEVTNWIEMRAQQREAQRILRAAGSDAASPARSVVTDVNASWLVCEKARELIEVAVLSKMPLSIPSAKRAPVLAAVRRRLCSHSDALDIHFEVDDDDIDDCVVSVRVRSTDTAAAHSGRAPSVRSACRVVFSMMKKLGNAENFGTFESYLAETSALDWTLSPTARNARVVAAAVAAPAAALRAVQVPPTRAQRVQRRLALRAMSKGPRAHKISLRGSRMEFFSDLTRAADVENRVRALDGRHAAEVNKLKTSLTVGMERALQCCRAQAEEDLQRELARLEDSDVDQRSVATEKDARLRAMTLEDLARKGRKARDDAVKRKLFELAGFEKEQCDELDAKYDEEHAPLKAARLGLERDLVAIRAERAAIEQFKLVAAQESAARLEHAVQQARRARAQLDPLEAAEWEETRPADFASVTIDASVDISSEMTQAMRRRAAEEKSRGEQQHLGELIGKVDALNQALEEKQQVLIEMEGAYEMSILQAEARARTSLEVEYAERVEQERRTYALAVDEVREKGRIRSLEAEARLRRRAFAVAQQEANERIAAIKIEFEASIAARVASVRHTGSQNEAKLQQRIEICQQESDVQQSLLEKCVAELQRLKGTVQSMREEGDAERTRVEAQYARATELIAQQREEEEGTATKSVSDEVGENAAKAAATKAAVAAAHAAAAKHSSAEPLSQIEAQIDSNLAQYPGSGVASPSEAPRTGGETQRTVADREALLLSPAKAASAAAAAVVVTAPVAAAAQAPARSEPPTALGRAQRAASTIRAGFSGALNAAQVLRNARIKGTRLLELGEASAGSSAWRERYLMVSILGWTANDDSEAGSSDGMWGAARDLTTTLGGPSTHEMAEFPCDDIYITVCFAGEQYEVALPRSASKDDPLPTPKSQPHLLFFVGTEDVVERLKWPTKSGETTAANGETPPSDYVRAGDLLARESLLVTASAQISTSSHAQCHLGEGEISSPLLARESREVAVNRSSMATETRDVVTGELAKTFDPWATTLLLRTANGRSTGLALDLSITVIDPTELASLGCGFDHSMPLGPQIEGGKTLQQRVAAGAQHPLMMAVCLRGRDPPNAGELNCARVACGGRASTLLVGSSTPVQTISGACANHAVFPFDGRPESRLLELSLFRTAPLASVGAAPTPTPQIGRGGAKKFGSKVLFHVEHWAGKSAAAAAAPKLYQPAYMEVDLSGTQHTLRFGRGRRALAIEFDLSRVHRLHAFGADGFADAGVRENINSAIASRSSSNADADAEAPRGGAVDSALLSTAFSFVVGPKMSTDDFLAAQSRRSHLTGRSHDQVARTFSAAFRRHAFVVTVCPMEEGSGVMAAIQRALGEEEGDELGTLPLRHTLPATVELHAEVPLHRPIVLQTYSGLLATVTWFDPAWIAAELPRIMQARRRHKESDEWAQLEMAAMQERVRKESGERASRQKHDRELSYLRTLREDFAVESATESRGRLSAARTELTLRNEQENHVARVASSATMLKEDHMYACERLKRLRTMLTRALRPLSSSRDDLLPPLDEGQQESERTALGLAPREPHQIVLDWAKRRDPFVVQLFVLAGTGTWGEVRLCCLSCHCVSLFAGSLLSLAQSLHLLTHSPPHCIDSLCALNPGGRSHHCTRACDGRDCCD